MKRHLLIVTAAIAVALGAAPRAADDLVIARFSDYLDSLRIQAQVPGLAAAIVSSTDVVWEQGFGLQDIDRDIAVRPDTPFEIDGLTEPIVASLILRCIDDGALALDDPVSRYDADGPDAPFTLQALLGLTRPGPDGPVFAYEPGRLAPLAPALAGCTGGPFRNALAALFDRTAMIDSVPGADAAQLTPDPAAPGSPVNPANPGNPGTPGAPGTTGIIDAATIERYQDVLTRLAVSYIVDDKGRATASDAAAPALTPTGGIISTVRDLEKFDLALKNGIVVRPETLAGAWTPPIDGTGASLPYGLGWFVQAYNGEPVVWQFGQSDGGSSMMLTLPGRGVTLILLANSSGLTEQFPLASGDVTVSPFARLFLGLFAR